MEDLTRGEMVPMENIKQLLSDGKLPPEIVETLQEAFDKKVEEVKQQAEMSVREEFSRRYDNDKENLVEAIDRMLTDTIQKQASERAESVKQFNEARDAFRKSVKESRKTFKTKLAEQTEASRTVVTAKLKEEILKLREQKKALVAERLSYADKLESAKAQLKETQNKRLKKIDEFVVRQVEKEMKEFLEDHKALVSTRLKLVTEGKQRLRATQTRFVKEAAGKVEKAINETLKSEMTQLHEDLERNRQNMFGRRIFEAMAAEYMTSYLAEGTEIRNLQNVLEQREKALADATGKLNEAVKENQIASRKAKLAEDRIVRTKVLSELLTNLRGEKRTVMEGMLETVKTDSLRVTFNKLLPVVLDETAGKPAQKRVLSEAQQRSSSERRSSPPSTLVSGDQRANRLAEAAEAERMNDIDPDIAQVVRLAGITSR
jgi:hypothetical protein